MNRRTGSRKAMKAPNFPKHELTKGLPKGGLGERGYYAQLLLDHEDVSEQTAEHLSFDQVLWQNGQLNNTHFAHVQMLDCRLLTCDLANANWRESSFARVELIDCHLTGFQGSETSFQDVFFKGCHGSFAQFALSSFKNVRFEECDLSEANFLGVDCSGITFVRCNLRAADLTDTKLVGVDLRGSQIDGARVGVKELKGAILEPQQALVVVRSLGIEVSTLSDAL